MKSLHTKLSKNLTLIELVKSPTATRHGIPNMPNDEQYENLVYLAKGIFQPVRDHFGCPIFISSGFRSEKLNKKIGGAKYSHHRLGCAIDMDQDGKGTGISNADVFHFIKNNLDYTQLIWEFGTDENPAWVHASLVKGQEKKKQILKAIRVNGKTKYINWEE
jgi:zinc D-Ala-D-Ala carboxypeptidase